MGLPAARMGDQVAHSNAMMGLLIGAALGAALAVAVVATGGLAAVAAGAMIAGGLAGGALAGEYIGAASMGPPTGMITIGSPDVFINGKPAAMTNIAMAICAKEYGVPQPIAQGAATVFIDHMPAARKNDKLVCSAVIIEGSPDVFFDDKTVQTLPITPEVPEWLNTTLQVVAIGAAVVGFGAAIAAVGFGAAVVGLAGGLIGGALGQAGGRALGEALGLSESATRGLEVAGGFLGGLLGGTAATRAYEGFGTNPEGVMTPPSEETCTNGCPISMQTGEELLAREDFVWQGPLTLAWKRFYRTTQSATDLQLGHGWLTPLDEWIEPAPEGGLVYHDHEGRLVRLPLPEPGGHGMNTAEQLRIDRIAGHVRIRPKNGPDRLFVLEEGRSALQAWSSRDGHRIDLVRDARGHVTALSASWGRFLVVQRQGARILSVSRARMTENGLRASGDPLVRYVYDADSNLSGVLDRLDHGERYAYRNHLLVRRTLASGFNFQFEWDGAGPGARCLRNWGDQGIYDYRFEWDPGRGVSRAIDSLGGVTEYEYASNGQLRRVTSAEGLTEFFRYSERGQLAEITGPLGSIARFDYDAEGRLAKTRDAAGATRVLAYDAQGRLVQLTDALGQAWQWQFDDRGRLCAIVDPAGASTLYRFNEQNLVCEITDAVGKRRVLWWDAQARVVAELGFDGVRRRFGYDEDDRVVSVATQDKRVVRYEWDETGRLAAIQSPAGGRIELRHNALGRVTHWRDANGNVTEYRYREGLNQPSERIDPLGQVLQYHYDAERNLIGLTNPNGLRYTLAWDRDRHLLEQVGFDGRRQRYKYDEAGRLAARAEIGVGEDGQPQWQVTQMQRDRVGRLVEKALPDGRVSRYGYDPLGRLSSAQLEGHAVRFGYDPLGRVTEEQQGEATVTHAYNEVGQRVCTTLPDGQALRFDWDERGKIAQVALDGKPLSRHRWDEFAQEAGRDQGDVSSRYDYDPNGQLVAQQAALDGGTRALLARRYVRDAAGHVGAIADLRQGAARYVYDPLERLVGVEGVTPERFVHDPAGNLLGDGDARVEGDRLVMQGDRHFRYDPAGNLVEERRGKAGRQLTRYEYDAENRLRVAHTPSGTSQYRYDALGRRIGKSTPGGETRFYWDGVRLLGEASAAGRAGEGASLRWYLYEPASFRPLACVQRTAKGAAANDAPAPSTVYYYHLDHLGTPREMTDARGRIVWSARYRAWGALALADVQEIDNPLRFAGQYHDVETGLHYDFQRYYDPTIGRFIHQDPIGLMGGTNLYCYAPNPVNWIDPLGLACAHVDDEGTLHIVNKYEPGSAEDLALREHVSDWNEQIEANGGSMTRQAVTPEMRAQADVAAAAAREANPADYPAGMRAGHTPDVGWGGAPEGPINPLNGRVNSYVGGATQAVPPGTTYNNVVLDPPP